MSDITFGVRLKADRAGFSDEMAGAGEDIKRLGSEARDAIDGADDLASSIGGLVEAAAGLAGLTLGAGLVNEFVAAADAMGQLDAQLRLATQSSAEFADVRSRLTAIALDNNAALKDTFTLYTKLAPAVREAGGGVAEAAAIVDAFAKTLRLSGATTEEASSATLQFAQAMGSGKLAGDEFRSISEANLRLMQALAAAMGRPVGALKDMAEQGQLTAAVIGNALIGQLDTLRQEADTLPTTVGQAFQNLGTEVLQAVQTINDQADITGGIVKGIDTLRDQVPALARELAGAARLIADNMDVAAFAVGSTLALGLGRAAGAAQALVAEKLLLARSTLAATVQYDALGVAIARTTVAQNASAAAARTAGAVLSGLGGPLGALVTVLGIGAAAWLAFGDAGKSAAEQTKAKLDAANGAIERLRNQAKFGAGDVGLIRAAIAALEAEMQRLAAIEKKRQTGADANQEWLYARAQIVKLGEKVADLRLGLIDAEAAAKKQDAAIKGLTHSTAGSAAAHEAAAKAAEALAKSLAGWYDERRKGLAAIDDEIAAERDALEAMGLSAQQAADLAAGKLDLAAAAKEEEAANLAAAAAYAGALAPAYRQAAADAERYAAKLRELAEVKRAGADVRRVQDEEAANAAAFDAFVEDLVRREKASDEASARMAQEHLRAWQSIYDDVGRGLTDAIFEGGRDGWELLRRSIEATAIRAYVQPIFTQGVAALGQAIGLGPGNATAGSLLGNLGGGALLGGLSGAGGFFGQAALGFSSASTSSLVAAGNAAFGAGQIGAGLGSYVGAAAPWALAAYAALNALGAFKGATDHRGGAAFAEIGGASGLASRSNTAGFDLGWGAYTKDRSAAVDASVAALVDGLAASIAGRAARYGGNASGVRITGRFASDNDDYSVGALRVPGFELDKHFDKNGEKGFAQFGAEAVRAEVAALQSLDLPDLFAGLLDTVDPLADSLDVLSQVLTQADAVAQQVALAEQLKASSEQDALEAVRVAGLSASSAWFESGERIREAAAAGSLSLAQMAEMAARHYQTELQLLQRIRQVGADAENLFADTRRSIELSVLGTGGKYDYLNAEITRQVDVLRGLTDVDEIQRYYQQINGTLNQAYGLLDGAQKAEFAPQFLARVDQLETIVSDRLDSLQSSVLEDQNTLARDLANAAEGVISRTAEAAREVLNAARDAIPDKIHVIVETRDPPLTHFFGGEEGDGG